MSRTVNILIADDHAVVRRGLKVLLDSHGFFKVVAEAETGAEAIEMAQAIHPDVAVLDIRMPGSPTRTQTREAKRSRSTDTGFTCGIRVDNNNDIVVEGQSFVN